MFSADSEESYNRRKSTKKGEKNPINRIFHLYSNLNQALQRVISIMLIEWVSVPKKIVKLDVLFDSNILKGWP